MLHKNAKELKQLEQFWIKYWKKLSDFETYIVVYH